MTETELSSSFPHSPPPRKHRRRRLIFDRRYGWIFDEWKDPSQEALSGGRAMFCILPMAQSLLNASISFAAHSVGRALKHPTNFSPPAYFHHLELQRKQQTWFRELEHSGLVADLKLIPCRTHCTLSTRF